MKTKTADLTGAALDWAVAKCMGREDTFGHGFAAKFAFYPSSRWSQGGPIIEREKIDIGVTPNANWRACIEWLDEDTYEAFGLTPLLAAMRCYVASKLGNDVEIPEEWMS